MTEPLLSVTDIGVSYRGVPALEDVHLRVDAGQITALVGESGSGKSTLAKALIGLLPTAATVSTGSALLRTNGVPRDLLQLSERQLQRIRGRAIGFVPQDPGSALNPVKTVGQTLAEALRLGGVRGRESVRQRALELLERVHITDPARRAQQYPHEFSGGMRQRVLLAAAVAHRPALLIADEATSALDVTSQRTVLDLLDELRHDTGTGVLLITHDLALAAERAQQLAVLAAGRLVETGQTRQVLSMPGQAYTAQLIADAPALRLATQSRSPEQVWLRTAERIEKPAGSQQVESHAEAEPRVAAQAVEGQPVLRVTDLSQRFGTRQALTDVCFTVSGGTVHAIVGESGSGKSTLARIIAGFDTPAAGSVQLQGQTAVGLRGRKLRQLRQRVQLVYQNPYASLNPRRTVAQTLGEVLTNFQLVPRSRVRQEVAAALERVALPAQFAERYPAELSGGQRQRVALARALMAKPQLLVLDEPVSALDVTVQAGILRLLRSLQRELGLTMLFISHDLAVVRQVADTVSVLHAGAQVEIGDAARVFTAPQHPVTRQLLAAIPQPVWFRHEHGGEHAAPLP